MKLPAKYSYLYNLQLPRHMLKAIELYGIAEVVGPKHNPVIMGWAEELGLKQYNADEIAWCGLGAAIVMHRAGREVVKDPLWARNWAKFGVAVPKGEEKISDVLVFERGNGGHVGFYAGESQKNFHVLGGNQGNRFSIVEIAKSRLIACRRPAYNLAPSGVQKYILCGAGQLSTNEA